MMPPPLHVCNGLASPAGAACRACRPTVKFVTVIMLFATRQQPCDIHSNFFYRIKILFLPFPSYKFAENVISLSVDGGDYFHQISSKSLQFRAKQKKCQCRHRTYIGTTGQHDTVKT